MRSKFTIGININKLYFTKYLNCGYWILYRHNLFHIIIIIYKLSLSTCKSIYVTNTVFFHFLNLYFPLTLNENTKNLNLKIKSINVGILHFIEIVYLILYSMY